MKEEFKQPWIDALRSGKYAQVKGALKTDQGYCCLGVLQEINGRMTDKQCSNGSYCSVTRKAGVLTAQDFEFFGTFDTLAAMGMNDIGCSFKDIADWIEANV